MRPWREGVPVYHIPLIILKNIWQISPNSESIVSSIYLKLIQVSCISLNIYKNIPYTFNVFSQYPCIPKNPSRASPVLRVTRPYLNLLVKPRIFSSFLKKCIILCILKGEMPFKMHKKKKFPEKNVCLLAKHFRPITRNTYFLFG